MQERVGAARNGAHGTLCKAAGLKRDVKTKNPTEWNRLPWWSSGRSMAFGENEHGILSGGEKKEALS